MESDQPNGTAAEPSVDEGAFWHTNMDLYYGYIPGEVVEVEHEPMKYWLARIEFSYKHLVLLKWLGNYGEEFWIDTSLASSATTGSSNNTSCASLAEGDISFLKDYPRRLFPLGHHLQSQIKSQFILEKPTKILIKPSLYNPAKDPYANIETVEDLLAHEIDSDKGDAFANQISSNNINEPASLVLVKNKTKINYGQEDQDELEVALQNLNDEIDGNQDDSEARELETFSAEAKMDTPSVGDSMQNKDSGFTSDASNNQSDRLVDKSKSESSAKSDSIDLRDENINQSSQSLEIPDVDQKITQEQQGACNDEARLEMCRRLQESAISKGRYMGIRLANSAQCEDEIYFLKPKQFFDLGGANQERVFVPGTLIEICHSSEIDNKLSLFHWFAFVTKNVGGRLTLRWFLCDEPKFKQGRLELKSSRSKFIQEEETNQDANHAQPNDDELKKLVDSDDNRISLKALTFSLHFCDPKVHFISYAKQNGRSYRLPEHIRSFLKNSFGHDEPGCSGSLDALEKCYLDHVFDPRRMNLDKDRPMIDHILSTVRQRAPSYLDLVFAPKDTQSKREVLISCPKMTKLIHGFIKRELEPNVFEVHSDILADGESIKFIYPYDHSYAILPLDWANNNQDCLSIHPSRATSPHTNEKQDDLEDNQDSQQAIANNTSNDGKETSTIESTKEDESMQQLIDSNPSCLLANRTRFPRSGGSFHKLPNFDDVNLPEKLRTKVSNLDEYDPKYWSTIIRMFELEAPSFHCCIDMELKNSIETKFKVMDQLEVVHPSSDSTICSGRIRKVVFPLLWIQISADSYTLLPFNSTNIYPARWCETYQHPIVLFLPPRKRLIDQESLGSSNQNDTKKKKKIRINEEIVARTDDGRINYDAIFLKESFDLNTLQERQTGIDYILNEQSMYIKIYFNHKCFTGPSLSKSKICTLPQYVGPGPMRLVLEEVVTKVISVAYVPPRILNDLSSKSFSDLLVLRNLKNTMGVEFKAKYQKRVHREDIPVCLNPDDVALYCECLCEHLKCCYNLFGPNQYDGDDCPGHCRALTKSNKFMKRATYYRDKARAGEFLGTNGSTNDSSKKSNGQSKAASTSRPRYTGRGSSESNSSGVSRSDQVVSRASSSSGDEVVTNDHNGAKFDGLKTVHEEDEKPAECQAADVQRKSNHNNDENVCDKGTRKSPFETTQHQSKIMKSTPNDTEQTREILRSNEQQQDAQSDVSNPCHESSPPRDEFDGVRMDANDSIASDPHEWSVEDVCRALDALGLDVFICKIRSECIDGRALLLLDEATIEEHFKKQSDTTLYPGEIEKLCRFVEFAKVRLAS